jgi:DNA-binding transcriptional LysR family regulator
MNITLRQLYGFKAVAHIGTFTGAAKRLGVAQPALSRIIHDLEAELEAKLFDRTTRRIELTAAGREFLCAVDKLISDLEVAVQSTRDLLAKKRGRVVVAAPPLLAATIVPSVIADYKRRFPGIDVCVIDCPTDIVVDRVRDGQADCAIGTFGDEDGLQREALFEDPMMVWCATQSHLAHARSPTWKELLSERLITLRAESQIRRLIDQTYLSIGECMQPAYEVSHMATAVRLVEEGLGVAVLPAYVWNIARGLAVVPRALCSPVVRREVSILRSNVRRLSPAAEAFMQSVRRHAFEVLPDQDELSA